MSNKKPKTWRCPLCDIDRMPYATTCENFRTCGNSLHVNGEWYLKNGYLDKSLRNENDVTSVGIAEIANKDMD